MGASCVVTQFEEHNKQKIMVEVVLPPSGVMYFNTTNTDITDGTTQEELIIKMIRPHNMTNVKLLLSQFLMSWYREKSNIGKWLAMEKAFNQLKEKATEFVWSNVSIPLPFKVQSKLDFDFIFDCNDGFCALMIHLTEPDPKYEGGMQHKMIHFHDTDKSHLHYWRGGGD